MNYNYKSKKMKKTILLLIIVLNLSQALAQNSNSSDTIKAVKKDPGLSGPSSVSSQLEQDAQLRKVSGIKQADSWLKEKARLSLGADYNVTTQMISQSPATTDAASGVLRFYGNWTPGKKENFTGHLIFKLESRHLLGTELTPQMLGPNAGYAGVTAATFSNVKFWFSNFYYTQSFWKNRFAFNVGVVDVTDYLNVHGLINIWTDFNNFNFATDASINPPNMGLGGVIRVMFTPNYYLIAGMADLNGDPHRPDKFFSSFFNDHEYFKHAEIGYISSWDMRYTNNIHLTFWQADQRVAAGVDDGWGMALSISQAMGPQWTTFLRGGYSEGAGTFLQKSVSAGAGYQLKSRKDYAGLGINWGQPPKSAVGGEIKNQYTLETYYRVQLLPHVLLWPSFQYFINPAYLPEKDNLWMLSLRLRAAL